MRKLKKGDKVVVMTGKDKGHQGAILQMLDAGERVVVDGAKLAKRHTRPNPQRNITGGIIEKAMAMHISNVAIFNPITNKPDRVGIKLLEDGRRVRIFKSTKEVIDN